MVCLSLTPSDDEPSGVTVVSQLGRAVVSLSYDSGLPGLDHCGGGVFVSGDGIILTTAKFLEARNPKIVRVTVTDIDSFAYDAVVLHVDKEIGLALLGARSRGAPTLFDYVDCLMPESVANGFHHIGHPFGMDFSYSSITVNSIDRYVADVKEYVSELDGSELSFVKCGIPTDWENWNLDLTLLQCTGIYGCNRSGFPIFDDVGRVIGLYAFQLMEWDFAVKVPAMDAFQVFLDMGRRVYKKKIVGSGLREGKKRCRGESSRHQKLQRSAGWSETEI